MKRSNIIKLFYVLLTLIAFSNNSLALEFQVNELYEYDAYASVSVVELNGASYEKHVYDEGCNFIHYGFEQQLKHQSTKQHTDGFKQETHAYQNTKTGQVVEHKTKIEGH